MTTARNDLPEADQAVPAVGIRLDRTVGRPAPERADDGIRNPNNCASCDHKRHPDGGWCYVFRDEPREVCMQHTARIAQRSPWMLMHL